MKMQGRKNTVRQSPTKAPRGYVVYRGPSVLDGEQIVVIAVLRSANAKTGDMIQTYILKDDGRSPLEVSQAKDDGTICGNCPHRQSTGGACYVNIGQSVNAVYAAYKRGSYPVLEGYLPAEGRSVRLGTYGDPAAVPFQTLFEMVYKSAHHTGYTHQAGHKNFDSRVASLCMISADTPKQAIKYQKQGLATFRVALQGDEMIEGEVECLSDSEGLTCLECGKCDGKSGSVVIEVHGTRSKRFKSAYYEPIKTISV